MSLFGSIQMAGNALQANDIGLQVTGQNISNANTPGYIREEMQLAASPPQKYGSLILGTGVQVQAVIEKVDQFLEQQLRGAVSNQASADTLKGTYSQLESIVGALDNNNLSSAMNAFFNSIQGVLNQPESVSVRNLAALQGATLTNTIQQTAQQAETLRGNVNTNVENMVADINRLTSQIGSLNLEIENARGGSTSGSDAIGLEDQRLQALKDLSKLVGVQTVNQTNGAVTVYIGGDYLVYDGEVRTVAQTLRSDGGQTVADIRVSGTNTLLDPSGNLTSGELYGLLVARDQILPGFLGQLNDFAGTLTSEFNKVYASGQGLQGFSTATSESAVIDPSLSLDNAGLTSSPVHGSFQIAVHDKTTGLTRTTDIPIALNGVGTDTTLNSLVAALRNVSGINASVGSDNRLTIAANSGQEFSFSNDTSGVLTALGINTFFTGSSALDIGVNAAVRSNPALFAASQGGIAADTANAVRLAQFPSQTIASKNSNSITTLYDNIVNGVTQGSAQAASNASSADAYAQTLNNQHLATSGVSIDQETIQMLSYQQAYQATAKYISTLADSLHTLSQL